jgi:hypothetical protein
MLLSDDYARSRKETIVTILYALSRHSPVEAEPRALYCQEKSNT